MAYEFRVGGVTGKGLKRIARQQLRQLQTQLHDRADAASGHHEARKCLKRLRALLLLARPAIGKAACGKFDRAHAAIARTLAEARDTTVILKLLGGLRQSHGDGALGAAGRRLYVALGNGGQCQETAAQLSAIEAAADKLAKTWANLPLKSFDAGSAFAGLEADYRAGRRQLRRATATGTSEDLHEMRKHIQRHWRHMQLFESAWPREFGVRIEMARALSETLGLDHDHWLLRQRLGKDAARLDRLCGEEQEKLRQAALPALKLFYSECPGPLRRRLQGYWASGG